MNRARAYRHAMFFRMLMRAAALRPGRALAALLAIVVAATVSAAMLNLFADVQLKLQKEFRNYGANIVLVPKDGRTLPSDALSKVDLLLADGGIAAPFAYVVAQDSQGKAVVVSGTNFDRARRVNSWWPVTAWPKKSGDALLGIHALSVVSPRSRPFDLSFQGHTIHLNPAGTLRTGAEEDSRIYISLNDFESWTGVQPSLLEIAGYGSTKEVDAIIQNMKNAFPDLEVRPVRQIREGEALVLGKTRATLLAASILIVLTAALCVLATLTGWVLDRRRDFAVMKALGASQRFLAIFFAAEAVVLGFFGAVLGFGLGVAVSAWIGRVNFHSATSPRFEVFPVVLAACIGIALLSAVVPISLLRRVQPAMILKGE